MIERENRIYKTAIRGTQVSSTISCSYLDCSQRISITLLAVQLLKKVASLRVMRADHDTSVIERTAKARTIPLQVVDIERPQAQQLYEKLLVLIRRDQYIA